MDPISLCEIFADFLDIGSPNRLAPTAHDDRIIIVATTLWNHLLTSCQSNSGCSFGIQVVAADPAFGRMLRARRPALMLIITVVKRRRN